MGAVWDSEYSRASKEMVSQLTTPLMKNHHTELLDSLFAA